MAYLLDTNVFIEAKNRYYDFDVCPGFWDWLDRTSGDGQLLSIEAVEAEIVGGDDELSEWVRDRSQLFAPPDAATVSSARTLSEWVNRNERGYRPAAITTFLGSADYWLVAHAHAHDHRVVTHETPSNAIRRIKTPDACIDNGVPFTNPWSMPKTLHARFVLPPPTPQTVQESLL